MIISSDFSKTDTQSQFQSDLLPAESLLWTGQPLRRVIFHTSDWFAIPFSLMWGGFALFWEWGASSQTSNSSHSVGTFFSLWGIPFVLIGQYMIWGRFLYTAWKKTRTFYAVTNKRVIVLNTATSRKITDAFMAGLTTVSVTTRADGIGTIEFAPEPERASTWFNNRNRGVTQMDIDLNRLVFFDIPEAKNVYQIIQSQREGAHKA
jgi:hypothetical protein